MPETIPRSILRAFSKWLAGGLLLASAQFAGADGTAFFSADQVAQGRFEFSQKCAVCHGAQLQGGGAPALSGRQFSAQWNGKSLKELYSYVHANMPLGQGGDLSSQEYADIVSYVLAQNGLPAGGEKLTPKSPMERVLDLSSSATSGRTMPSAPAGVVTIGKLYGKLAQPTTSRPSQAELDAADASTTDWLMYNKGYRGERYSTLKKINAGNADRLRPVCMYQLGELGTFSTGPVMYDGILYATTHLGTYAIDATSCRKLWTHHHVPQGPEMNATNKG
ncbi:MAG TPA: c-type cytochrome, partial [Casimicrobiaceae bacterium]|nr:c-type cytochrome [Casimicrobiaceae bacterium]